MLNHPKISFTRAIVFIRFSLLPWLKRQEWEKRKCMDHGRREAYRSLGHIVPRSQSRFEKVHVHGAIRDDDAVELNRDAPGRR